MHLPVTSKHGFHNYEIKADAIEAAQARSSEASQGRVRFLDTEPYFLGPQPGRGPWGHRLWAIPPVGTWGELASQGNPESSLRASRMHGREIGPTAECGPESTARSGARCASGLGASTVSDLKAVPGQACLQRLGKERAGGEGACPGSLWNGAVWVCAGDSGLSPGSPASYRLPRPEPPFSSPCLGRPSPAPSLSSQAAEGASRDKGPPPRLPNCQALPVAGPGQHTCWTTARLASRPQAGRAQRPSAVRRVSSDGRLWARHALQSCSFHGRQPGGEGCVGRLGCCWGAGLLPPVGNSPPGTWNEALSGRP